MFHRLFAFFLISVTLLSCSKKDKNPDPVVPVAPVSISAQDIVFNNLNTSALPSGVTADYVYAKIYAGNVLLATSNKLYMASATLPQGVGFSSPAFSYSNQSFTLKLFGETAGQEYALGTVDLELKNYSSDKYPQPKDLFYNVGGNAGTLHLNYY